MHKYYHVHMALFPIYFLSNCLKLFLFTPSFFNSTWQRIHFGTCEHMPEGHKEKYKICKETDLTRGRKSHWINSAYEMGLRNVDSERSGITYNPNSPIDVDLDYTASETPRGKGTIPRTTSASSSITKKKKAKTKSSKNKTANDTFEATTLAVSYDNNDGGTTTFEHYQQQQHQQQQQQQPMHHNYQQQHQQQQHRQHRQHRQQQDGDVNLGMAGDAIHDFDLFGMEFDETIL
jgi:hypothetical protein